MEIRLPDDMVFAGAGYPLAHRQPGNWSLAHRVNIAEQTMAEWARVAILIVGDAYSALWTCSARTPSAAKSRCCSPPTQTLLRGSGDISPLPTVDSHPRRSTGARQLACQHAVHDLSACDTRQLQRHLSERAGQPEVQYKRISSASRSAATRCGRSRPRLIAAGPAPPDTRRAPRHWAHETYGERCRAMRSRQLNLAVATRKSHGHNRRTPDRACVSDNVNYVILAGCRSRSINASRRFSIEPTVSVSTQRKCSLPLMHRT